MSMISRLRRRPPKDPQEPGDADDQTSTEATAEDSPSAEAETEIAPAPAESPAAQAETEVAVAADAADEADADGESDAVDEGEVADTAVERGPSRLSGRLRVGIAALLVVLAGAISAGGYFALRYHQQSLAIARNDAAALKAAIDCVSATQAPDSNAMLASEQKIIDCGTDAFRTQALLYTSMLVQAYKASNVHVEVSDVRAAVERNNPDGSVEVLVAMRVKVAGDQGANETGYRLRVKMAMAEGSYRIAKLDQVTK
jgi:Mce-associated membrane protein